MLYDFAEMAKRCHHPRVEWDYHEDTKCGYCPDSSLDVPVVRYGWMTMEEVEENGGYDTCEGWEHEEQFVDWEGDDGINELRRTAKRVGETIVAEIDTGADATICVDYKHRVIYAEEIYGYHGGYRVVVTPDGDVTPYPED